MFAGLFAKFLALPLIGKILGWGKGRGSTIVGYVLTAIVIVFASFTVTLWFSKQKMEKSLVAAASQIQHLQNKVTAVEQVNAAQEDVIKNLQELRVVDNKALTGLSDDYRRLNLQDKAVSNKLTALEKSNAPVREYLDQPLPPELRELLNGPQAGTGNPRRR